MPAPVWPHLGDSMLDGGAVGRVQGLSPRSLPGGGDKDTRLGWMQHEESRLKVVVGSMGGSGRSRREKEGRTGPWLPLSH